MWNGPGPGGELKRMRIEGSVDGERYVWLGDFTLTTVTPASEVLAFGGPVVRYVRFVALENGAGHVFPFYPPPNSPHLHGHAQLAEVAVRERGKPPPRWRRRETGDWKVA